jgi:hypothetical protein
MTKSELIDALRTSGERAATTLAAVPAPKFEEGRYESGWNGRQILAHMASIEWTYPRLLDLAKGALSERPATPAPSHASAPAQTSPMQADGMASGSPQILGYNDRQVAKREGVPVADLIAEFEKNRVATIAAVETADDALFAKEITSAGGAKGLLADVMNFVAVQHVLGHLRDITGEGA